MDGNSRDGSITLRFAPVSRKKWPNSTRKSLSSKKLKVEPIFCRGRFQTCPYPFNPSMRMRMNEAPWLTRFFTLFSAVLATLFFTSAAFSADAQDEWKKTVEAAKKEGKVVVGGPP